MASSALHLKSHYIRASQSLLKTTTNFTFTHSFSSPSSSDHNSNNNNNNDDENTTEKQYPFSGYFKDIKSKLNQHHHQQQQHPPGFGSFTSIPMDPPPKPNSFDEIKKNLSEFRRRSSENPSSQQQQPQPNLFQNARNKNVGNPISSTDAQSKTGNVSFDAIRESLRQMKGKVGRKSDSMGDPMSLNAYKKSLKMQPTMTGNDGVNKVIGGSPENLPLGVFGKELRGKGIKKGEAGFDSNDDNMLDIEFAKLYTYDDLGDKLRELRPETKGKKVGEENWFSLSELNDRVKKIKEIEEKQLTDGIVGSSYGDLRMSLRSLKEEAKTTSMQGIKILPQPRILSSPKEHLVERYFHPDNMSSEEKLKLKLKTVRDEFKIHESDCGSVRVQIAQLTTEILHLSSVLHKKDKHSRRGLQAKVQQRKKLLKYLRRTDWESYSFVLSKLGLRDNPDYKN